jgi:hypothetical protein
MPIQVDIRKLSFISGERKREKKEALRRGSKKD